jgi:hypothetical protein
MKHTITWRTFSFDSSTKATTHEDRVNWRIEKQEEGTEQVEVAKKVKSLMK